MTNPSHHSGKLCIFIHRYHNQGLVTYLKSSYCRKYPNHIFKDRQPGSEVSTPGVQPMKNSAGLRPRRRRQKTVIAAISEPFLKFNRFPNVIQKKKQSQDDATVSRATRYEIRFREFAAFLLRETAENGIWCTSDVSAYTALQRNDSTWYHFNKDFIASNRTDCAYTKRNLFRMVRNL